MRNPEKQTITEVIAILHDQPFGVLVDIIRNVRTLIRRTSNEGISFLTKTLPAIGKRFDQSLSGNVAFNISGFLKKSNDTCFPHFLGSALRRVFDSSGFLLQNPCYETVKFLRTLFYYAYKIEVPFDEDTLNVYYDRFVEVDLEVSDVYPNIPDNLIKRMKGLLAEVDNYKLSTPAFGPGVSSNCKRDKKYDQVVPPFTNLRNHFGWNFFQLNKPEFPAENIALFAMSLLGLGVPLTQGNFSGCEPAKLLFVPKDSRGPRTICCEDSRLMWAQKSLQKTLYRGVESSKVFGGRVNFTDQSINQKLTFDKRFATLDLKEASDRVSNDLVQAVFPPKMALSLDTCRNPFVSFDNKGATYIHKMNKFAPMGSAVCFPIMALIAFSSVVSYISMKHKIPTRVIECYVYGDDIIIPNVYAEDAIRALNLVGLVVNEGKSFVNSRFTESCGADTLDQFDVTPLRKKKNMTPLIRINQKGKPTWRDGGFIPHYISLANAARSKGFKNLYASLRQRVEKSLPRGIVIPYGVPESPYLNWHCDPDKVWSYNLAEGYERNGKLRAICVKDQELKLALNPYSRLLRDLLEGGGDKPLNPNIIGARLTYLQPRIFTKWGTSYA